MEIFKVGNIIAITDICDVHNKECTKNYKIISVSSKGNRLQLDETDDNTVDCVFMGTHYCSSQSEPIDNPYLTWNCGKYALESEDYETAIFNLCNVKILI